MIYQSKSKSISTIKTLFLIYKWSILKPWESIRFKRSICKWEVKIDMIRMENSWCFKNTKIPHWISSTVYCRWIIRDYDNYSSEAPSFVIALCNLHAFLHVCSRYFHAQENMQNTWRNLLWSTIFVGSNGSNSRYVCPEFLRTHTHTYW